MVLAELVEIFLGSPTKILALILLLLANSAIQRPCTILLARDSVHGKLEDPIELEGNRFLIGDQNVKILPGERPGEIPWSTMDIDFVIDATGAYL